MSTEVWRQNCCVYSVSGTFRAKTALSLLYQYLWCHNHRIFYLRYLWYHNRCLLHLRYQFLLPDTPLYISHVPSCHLSVPPCTPHAYRCHLSLSPLAMYHISSTPQPTPNAVAYNPNPGAHHNYHLELFSTRRPYSDVLHQV